MDMLLQFIARSIGLNKKIFDALKILKKSIIKYKKLLLIIKFPKDKIKKFINTKGDMYMRRYKKMKKNAFINELIQEVEEYEQTDEK